MAENGRPRVAGPSGGTIRAGGRRGPFASRGSPSSKRSATIPAPPVSRLLGFSLTEVEAGRAVFECEPSESHYNPIGTVHGGVISTLLDSALSCSVHATLPAGTGYTTAELKMNLVRPVVAGTGRLRSEGRVIHAGNRPATAEARLTDVSGKLYAHAVGTCLVFAVW